MKLSDKYSLNIYRLEINIEKLGTIKANVPIKKYALVLRRAIRRTNVK